METLPDLDAEQNDSARERRKALWQALEVSKSVPSPDLLPALSGLLNADLTRAAKAWHELELEVRRELVHSLRQVADDDFAMDFSALFRIAMEDDDAEIRAASIAGFEEVDDVRLVPVFIRILRGDPSETARAAAADALAKYVLLGELEKIRPQPFNDAVTALCDSYLDASEALVVRSQALRAIAYTEEHDVPDIIAGAYKDTDVTIRISAIVAMGRSADEAWGNIARRELSNPIPELRLEATRACGELQLAAAVDEIAELVEDVDQRIRITALWALGRIGGKVAQRTLAKYGNIEDETLRTAADEALEELGFFSGDLSDFFGPPGGTDSESEAVWQVPGLINQDNDDEDMDDDWDADEELDEATDVDEAMA